ncbi:hypothetical protein [Bradyrhizobium sp. CCBAU 53380]|uniref:hypothetical protein n=1 Tax=Bradyrhizobium sp. CCBAU 53380 TaxID=1325117 RepID=UPI0023033D92|nr:hypothetical protein [Bradyrhizobium sp. CCBAU 53380]
MKTSKATARNTGLLSRTIKEALEALTEHWIYDAVQLLNDCAVGLERATQLLSQLQTRPEWLAGNEQKVMKEISQLVLFIKDWEALAHERLTDALVCPDEVEFRLEALLKASSMPARDKKKIRGRWSEGDTNMEPPIVDIARRHWNNE